MLVGDQKRREECLPACPGRVIVYRSRERARRGIGESESSSSRPFYTLYRSR